MSRRSRLLALAAVLAVTASCRQGMYNQPKKRPLSESDFFADGRASRVPPADTVARGFLREDRAFFAGTGPDGKFVATLPAAVTAGRGLREVLLRGRERYEIYCSPCHARQGNGRGMIVQRGFKQPPSFHTERLRQQPIGYLFDVMTNGFNQMSSYASQVPPEDRWAIAAYVRALQLSQNARVEELAPADREALAKADAGGAR